MSESFFFACIPRHLRVEHSFAKGIKPNTMYRVGIFKGIQKSDEMKQAIKSKIVGGKIDLESHELFFNIPFYNPTKNIHFNIKLYEQKPNEDQIEIGSFKILSSDYIKSYKTENKAFYSVEGMLQDDLFICFDLIVEKSKFALTDALKKSNEPVSKVSKEIADDNNSQSSRSRQVVREGEGFLSPRKRIQRKNGRVGKLRSRNSSRSDGQQSQEGSVASSRRKFQKSPSGRQEKFLQSPKRFSPAKNSERPKSIPKSDISDNKMETKSQAISNQKTYKYQPSSNQKLADNKEILDVKIERKQQKQNIVEKPQVAKSNIVSNSAPRGIQSPVSQSSVRQPVSQLNVTQPLSPRSPTYTSPVNNSVLPTSPKSVTQSPSKVVKQVTPSVVNPKVDRAQFQIKITDKVFDIVNKKEESVILISPQTQKVPQTKDAPLLNQSKSKSKISNIQKQEQTQIKEVINKNSSLREDKSEKTAKSIQVKEKQVKRDTISKVEKEQLKTSQKLSQNKQNNNLVTVEAEKSAAERKNQIIYAIFLVVSAFLIYHSMMPTRRV